MKNSPFENLANAIILQAARDYRKVLSCLKMNPYSKMALSAKKEIECFFRSNWFAMMTNIDPEMLMKKLKAEVA